MCEYGSKDLKGFLAEDNEERVLVDGSDAYDVGAADLTDYLSEQLNCIAVVANFSKLIIDPGLPLANANLVRLTYDSNPLQPVSFNGSVLDYKDRIKNFYVPFTSVLAEALFFSQPQLVINIRTHDKNEWMGQKSKQ